MSKAHDHPTDEALGRLLGQEGSLGERTYNLVHLMSCERCLQRLTVLYPLEADAFLARVLSGCRPAAVGPLEPEAPAAFERAMERARGAMQKALVEKRDALVLWEQLARLEAPARRLRVENSPRCHTLALGYLLLEAAKREWRDEPELAEELADLGVRIGEKTAGRYPPALRGDFLVLAHAYRGNARRIRGHFRAAHRDFQRARRSHAAGGGVAEGALLNVLEAYLWRDRGEFSLALTLVDQSLVRFQVLADWPEVIKVTTARALILKESGDPRGALAAVEELLSSAAAAHMTTTDRFVLFQYRTSFLLEIGAVEQARGRLPELRELSRCGTERDGVRVSWLEGRVHEAGGDRLAAEAKYRECRAFFTRCGLGYDAALVSLDLAALYLDQHRYDEVAALAEEMVPLFLASDVHREAVVALTIFREAVVRKAADRNLVAKLAGYLEQVQDKPRRARDRQPS
jgi:hypothetical protein